MNKLHSCDHSIWKGPSTVLPNTFMKFPALASSHSTKECDLVRGILQVLQGFSSSLFWWDKGKQKFVPRNEVYVPHLSRSLDGILGQFLHAATCLQLVDNFVKRVNNSSENTSPTLQAFANTVAFWLKRLRDTASVEEARLVKSDHQSVFTFLGLVNSCSSICSSAEYLLNVITGVFPSLYLEYHLKNLPCEMAVHILDYLYKKLDEVCLVQSQEDELYHLVLVLLVGSLLPSLEVLDSWLFDGILDDPFEEMFFYPDTSVAIDQSDFWEKSYKLRTRRTASTLSTSRDGGNVCEKGKFVENSYTNVNEVDEVVCPRFLRSMVKLVVSAGKSLQLIQYVSENQNQTMCMKFNDRSGHGSRIIDGSMLVSVSFPELDKRSVDYVKNAVRLTLPEAFCISLSRLLSDGIRLYRYFTWENPCDPKGVRAQVHFDVNNLEKNFSSIKDDISFSEIYHSDLLNEVPREDKFTDIQMENINQESGPTELACSFKPTEAHGGRDKHDGGHEIDSISLETNIEGLPFLHGYPVENGFGTSPSKNNDIYTRSSLAQYMILPPLNDENLRDTIFAGSPNSACKTTCRRRPGGTDYAFGFQFDEFEHARLQSEKSTLEALFPLPTFLPSVQENDSILEYLPFQKTSTLASRILNWILHLEPKNIINPVVILQECLVIYMKNQVDYIGTHILLKLMKSWRLMDQLGVLRAIYLFGSGDLLQHFLMLLFGKLDRGDFIDDEFELNTVLQESIRNSADRPLLSKPDSLVVSIGNPISDVGRDVLSLAKDSPRHFVADALDLLKFTYKVPWPLELIANMEALEKYNQVMGFLLKVKHAKFVLDKVQRWMWKDGSMKRRTRKRHLLVEQKLLHFVNAFHQYVMDRVFHNAWLDLCDGMASACSLDEVIEVHDSYLASIQRLCFVAPDKLWALIAARIKNILKLALDFYTIQQSICSGMVTSAIKATYENEVEQIEKQFDECVIFLLRILSFKLNVGQFPHLEDLVTRINYNYFYMSQSGSLAVASSYENLTKLVKT